MISKKINFHFYNTLCSRKTYDFLFKKHNVTSGNAAQKFFNLLAEGLSHDSNACVFVNSILPVNPSEQKRIFWVLPKERVNKIDYKYIPIINLPFLNNLWCSTYVFFQVLFKKRSYDFEDIIILDFLRFSLNFPIVLACKFRKFKTLVIATDLPGEGILQEDFKTKIRNLFIFSLSYDFYVCLTKDLNKEINRKNKPALIIEGFANIEQQEKENLLSNKFKNRIIIYAGGLYEKYGIKILINAFSLTKASNLRLWFYGVGPFKDQIIEYSKIDHRIDYKGVVSNSDLMEILPKATLLINPRPTNEIYTKFSFPSKNIEYMSIGTPLITTKLKGIPNDHFPHIYIIEEESILGIYNSLTYVLEKSNDELHQFGLRCKEFTLKEKNNIVQTKKIIDMLKNEFLKNN